MIKNTLLSKHVNELAYRDIKITGSECKTVVINTKTNSIESSHNDAIKKRSKHNQKCIKVN